MAARTARGTDLYRDAFAASASGDELLRMGWHGLRVYLRRAREAIGSGDRADKAAAIHAADQLLVFLQSIVAQGGDAELGASLTRIYQALQAALLNANLYDDAGALDWAERELIALQRSVSGALKEDGNGEPR